MRDNCAASQNVGVPNIDFVIYEWVSFTYMFIKIFRMKIENRR